MESKALEATEKFSAERSTAPRVTLDSMKARIISEQYLTLGAAFDAIGLDAPLLDEACPLDVYTLCVLVLDNGWVIVGHSAPAAPENYDKVKGETFAYEKAINQLWPMEGYLLRDQLAKGSKEISDG